jgi:hypothetical protein
VVEPADRPLIEFIGEIGEDEKGSFLGNALALLFPIDWPEPFGLVLIEAMANGTPVIAFGRGSGTRDHRGWPYRLHCRRCRLGRRRGAIGKATRPRGDTEALRRAFHGRPHGA